MAARDREDAQQERLTIKRPWNEEKSVLDRGNTWHGVPLPPVNATAHTPIAPSSVPAHSMLPDRYTQDSIEPGPKRTKYDQSGYHSLQGDNIEVNKGLSQSRRPPTLYDATHVSRVPLQSPGFSSRSPNFPSTPKSEAWQAQTGDRSRFAESHDLSNLCRRCRQIVVQQQDVDQLSPCANCKNDPELASLTQATAQVLTELAGTLSSGISSDQRQRGVAWLSPQQFDTAKGASAEFPPMTEYGLKHTLNWILTRIHHVNSLADKLVKGVPPQALQGLLDNDFSQDVVDSRDHRAEMAKRRLIVGQDEGFPSRSDAPEHAYDAKLYSSERTPNAGEAPSIRSNYTHPSSQSSPNPRISIMNPPLTLNRQLPSPPGRSVSSPTSVNYPSPSASTFGNTSQPISLPPPSSIHQLPGSSYLPPIGNSSRPSTASDSALQAHSAALQHEVSVQKIALSSLQGEHDKLLAAYSRSQTRASALEKKHNVSDAEIISLTEEKLRLQAQVLELEKDVEDLSKSRDECRQAAVQEGAQYVKIVRKASQLEEMAAEDRKNWNIMKAKMEGKIQSLIVGKGDGQAGPEISALDLTPPSYKQNIDKQVTKAQASKDAGSEPLDDAEARAIDDVRHAESVAKAASRQVRLLEKEIQRLQKQCTDMEATLRAVREDSRSMANHLEALGLASKSISDRAKESLESGSKS